MEDLENIHFNHSVGIQIRFNDIDQLGHVNNASQISFLDYGKVRYFEAMNNGEVDWRDAQFVIVNINVSYVEQIFMNDNIEVRTKITEIGNKSIKLLQMIVDRDNGHVKTVCHGVMCAFDMDTQQSVLVSQKWRDKINKFEVHRLTLKIYCVGDFEIVCIGISVDIFLVCKAVNRAPVVCISPIIMRIYPI